MKPDLWRGLASGCLALSLLTGVMALINAARIEYRLYGMHRVELRLLDGGADLALWAAAATLLALVLLIWRRPDWFTILLGVIASGSAVLLVATNSAERSVIVVGALSLFLLTWRIAHFDRRFVHLTWLSLAILLIIVEALALAHWLLFPYYRDFANTAAGFDMNLAYSGYALVKILIVALALSWIPMLVPRIARALPNQLWNPAKALGNRDPSKPAQLGLLLVVLGLSVVIGYFPYFRIATRLVGGDIECCYMPTLNAVLADGFGLFQGSDRIFFYAILYAIHLATGASAFRILMILPSLLTLSTALATFIFVKFGLRNFWVALSAAVVSAVSFNTTAAIFMDLFANWFGNVLLLLFLGLLLYALRGGRRWRLTGASAVIVSVSILFSHALVWWSMMAIVTSFGVAGLALDRERRVQRLGLLGAVLIANLFAYLGRLNLGTSGSVLDANVVASNYSTLAWGLFDGSVYEPFWSNLSYFIDRTSVFYANSLILVLAIAGSFLFGLRTRSDERDLRRMLAVWMLIGGVLTVTLSNVLNPYYSATAYWPLVWRGLFMTPVQVPAGIALSSRMGSRSAQFAYVLLVLVLANFAFRTLALTIIV